MIKNSISTKGINFIAKHGRNIKQEVGKIFFNEVRKGGLKHVNKREREEVLERIGKVFTKKDGKISIKAKKYDLDKEIFNPLARGRKGSIGADEVSEVKKALGLSNITRQIGNKYSRILKREKREEYKKRFEEKFEAEKAEKIKIETEKKESRFSGKPDGKIWQVEKQYGFRASNKDEIERRNASFGGTAKDKFFEKNWQREGALSKNNDKSNIGSDEVKKEEKNGKISGLKNHSSEIRHNPIVLSNEYPDMAKHNRSIETTADFSGVPREKNLEVGKQGNVTAEKNDDASNSIVTADGSEIMYGNLDSASKKNDIAEKNENQPSSPTSSIKQDNPPFVD